jgi:hypothetical protein
MHEFESLWKTQPLQAAVNGEEMLDIIIKKSAAFDRRVAARDRRETLASLVVAVLFGVAAWVQTNPLQRAGSLMAVAAAIWIVFHIRRNRTHVAPDPLPDQSLTSYRQALVSKIDHQIRLLKTAKFWYVLPLYMAVLVIMAGSILERARTRPLVWSDATPVVLQTLFFGAVWWLNEVYAVRKLRKARLQLDCNLH